MLIDLRTRYDAIFFDFDGTLADSYPAITASVNAVRERIDLPPLTVDQIRPKVGRGLIHLLRELVHPGAGEQEEQWYREHHPAVLFSHTSLLPGAKALVERLEAAGKQLGVCSNKPSYYLHELLRHFELASRMKVVLGPNDVDAPKPSPEMLLKALEQTGVAADRALFVGDMSIDVRTARAAGIDVWCVSTGSEGQDTLLAAGPDRLFQSLEECLA